MNNKRKPAFRRIASGKLSDRKSRQQQKSSENLVCILMTIANKQKRSNRSRKNIFHFRFAFFVLFFTRISFWLVVFLLLFVCDKEKIWFFNPFGKNFTSHKIFFFHFIQFVDHKIRKNRKCQSQKRLQFTERFWSLRKSLTHSSFKPIFDNRIFHLSFLFFLVLKL